ncbi:MAG: T9SS type A sorting domain-containing protein [Lewinellaceae bacterium]|nr:T9SS type A sorting domain-containing protein [Lewinellaceae bacterium]
MNAFSLHVPIRIMLLVSFLISGTRVSLWSQNAGPYKNIVTALNLPVSDTVSGQNLSIYPVSPVPKNGTVTIQLLQSGGSGTPYIYAVNYTPDPGFMGVDTFTLELNYQGSYPYLVYRGYRVSVFRSLLTIKSDFAVTTSGTPVTTDVLANDLSNNGPLSITAIPQVKNGTATLVGNNSIRFSPAPGFTGIGYVNYVACDATGACQTAQLAIGVSNNQTPGNDTLHLATAKNTALTMPLRHAGYSLFQAPANGLVVMQNDHAFRYTPNQNFTGVDQFILSSTAFGGPVQKTVFVEVLNTVPSNTMALPDRVFTPKETPVSFNVRQNDIGNLLVKSWVVPSNFPGTISNTNGSGNVTFTPNPGFSGVATFSYKIGNMFVPDLEIAPVEVVVGNLAPSKPAFELTTPTETPMVINYAIPFTGFDFDVIDQPDHGNLDFFPGFSSQTINGQSVSGYNLLVYTPDNGYAGLDQFEINYCVASNGQCQPTKITVSVINVFSAPGPYCVTDCVWTGDVNTDGVVNNKDLLPMGYYMGLSGTERDNASFEWYGQQANNWNNPFLGNTADLKHADTDGNGMVNSDDTLAISYFYGLNHQLTPHIPPSSKGLQFSLNLLTPNPGVGDLVEVAVHLGSSNQPVTNLYGYTFNASLSPQILDSALQINFLQGSWMNQNAADIWMSKNPKPGRLESAFTRTNGVAASGHGVVGIMSFIIIDIVDDSKLNAAPYFTLEVDAPEAMWADGQRTAGTTISLDIPLRLHRKEPVSNTDFFVYPSPAKDLLQVHLNGDDVIESLTIFDQAGKMVFDSGSVQWEHAELNIGHLPNGLYIAAARTAGGHVVKKFQIIR